MTLPWLVNITDNRDSSEISKSLVIPLQVVGNSVRVIGI